MQTFNHKINEKVRVLSSYPDGDLWLTIYNAEDGTSFRFTTNEFQSYDSLHAQDFRMQLEPLGTTGFLTLTLATLPTELVRDMIFQFLDEDFLGVSTERHVFGGAPLLNEHPTCLVYGTVINPSGEPIPGAKVEAYNNSDSFFSNQGTLIGHVATALTDDTGYFELPLVVGTNVTINIPITGFTTRGVVPAQAAVELRSGRFLPGSFC